MQLSLLLQTQENPSKTGCKPEAFILFFLKAGKGEFRPKGKHSSGALCPVSLCWGQSQTKWPPAAPALAWLKTRVTGWQRALAGQSESDAIVMPIKLRIELADESGTQDPDRPSGWWDVQALESQCAQIIIPVGILARSRRHALLPAATHPLPIPRVEQLSSVYASFLPHPPRAVSPILNPSLPAASRCCVVGIRQMVCLPFAHRLA